MKKLILNLLAVALAGMLVTTLAWGQGRGAGRAAAAQSVVLQGIVESADLVEGQGPPSFVLLSNGVSSKIQVPSARRPGREALELQRGDEVEVVAFPSRWDETTLVASSVKNLQTGYTFEVRKRGARGFRGADRPGAPGRGLGPCPQSFNSADAVTISGAVVETSGMSPGERFPSVKLSTGETVMVGPYRALADSGFEMKQGDLIVVRAFPSARVSDAFIALSIENQTAGTSLVLRGEDGFPKFGGRGQGRRGGPRPQ